MSRYRCPQRGAMVKGRTHDFLHPAREIGKNEGVCLMVRGLLSGVAVGAIVSVLGLGLVSLILPLDGLQADDAPARQAAQAPVADTPVQGHALQDKENAAPEEEMAPDTAPVSPLAALDDSTDAPAGFTAGLAAALPDAAPDIAPDLAPERAPDPRPAPQATRLAQVVGPDAGEVEDFTDPGARPEAGLSAPDTAGTPATGDEAANMPGSIEQIPVPPPGEAVAPDLPMAEKPVDPAITPEGDDGTSAPPSGTASEIVLLPDGSQVLPDGRVEKPRVFAAGEGAGLRADPDVATDRLPQIGAGAAPSAAAPTPDASAWKTNRAAFERPEGAALFSVVLIDRGIAIGGLDQDTLLSLGYPLTIAIDPARSDARAVAQAYRSAGYEVAILMTGLPASPVAQDLDTAMEAWRQAVPGAVALVEPAAPVVQNDRQLSQHLLELAERDGLALITQDRGSNSASQLAHNADWPEAKIWRVLDDGRERASHIARELTRAEFEAKRDGKTVVMLSAWPESVAGLRDWASGAHDDVALAPVSAQFDTQD
ncbi:divergent polysaccharide deacetylase family protein [Thioclava sp. 'Guangxiensis']|uniref:divergent polysaccharide deacetylase family protein n=1 Tax=Thioclava sp. 'Guangxiensis' TaxID=3149044 RepID=UPI0038780C41